MFGDRLKELRKSRHLTQKQLADIIGVERSSLCKYEGKYNVQPSDDVIIRIAEYFDVSIDYLMGKTDVFITENAGFTAAEYRLINTYRMLNTPGQKIINDIVQMFLLNPDYTKEDPDVFRNAFINYSESENKSEAEANGDTYCSSCKKFIEGKVRICPYCGQYIK